MRRGTGQAARGGTLLMTMAEIAELARVQRPVVTVWRRRHPDFPAPVAEDGGRPLFDGRQVGEWLVRTNRAEPEDVSLDLHLYTLVALGSSVPSRELIAALTALICLRHLDGEPLAEDGYWDLEELQDRAADADPDDELLRSEITAIPHELGRLARTADEMIEAAWGCRGAFERIMAARYRLGVPELAASAVDPGFARLVAGLSGADEHARRTGSVVVADPAAGAGDLLTAVVERVGEDGLPTVLAAEPDAYLARLLRRRMALRGVEPPYQDIRVGTGLDEDAEPDAIVTQLPYTPGESRSAPDVLDAIDRIGLGLARNRTAVILGPADVLTGALPLYSHAERRRTELLGGGLVEAVLRLPGGLIPFRPGYETAVWVLNSVYSAGSTPQQGRVLLGDVSDRRLTPDVVDALITDVVMWRREGAPKHGRAWRFCAPVDLRDLADRPGPLTVPRRPSVRTLVTKADKTVARVAEVERTLDRLADPVETRRPRVRSGIARATAPRPGTISLGALLRQGRLSLVRGSRVKEEHIGGGGHHPVLGAEEVAGHAPAGARLIDRGVLAEHYPRAVLTEPGDVLVTTVPRPGLWIDHRGFSVVEFPARALRVTAAGREQLTPRVLAALLRAGAIGPRAPGAVRAPRRLEDWEIPLLDPRTARRFDEVLTELDERRAIARAEIDALDELSRIAATGLVEGTLTLRPIPTR